MGGGAVFIDITTMDEVFVPPSLKIFIPMCTHNLAGVLSILMSSFIKGPMFGRIFWLKGWYARVDAFPAVHFISSFHGSHMARLSLSVAWLNLPQNVVRMSMSASTTKCECMAGLFRS